MRMILLDVAGVADLLVLLAILALGLRGDGPWLRLHKRRRHGCLPKAEILDWGKGIFCMNCGRTFDDQRTLVLHCNAAHPDTYDDEEKMP